jgi:tripartite-type tricarboxylate transporter receptor subunit TctC
MAGELFKMMAGVNTVHVPYRGAGPMLTDLLGGQVQVAFDGVASSIEHIRSGKLRERLVTPRNRSHSCARAREACRGLFQMPIAA